MSKIYVVYGNHGRSPAQLEDYHLYLMQALSPLGFQVTFCEDPVPGHLNLLIECFDAEFTQKVSAAAAIAGTRFILIATEFLTGSTFNDFKNRSQTRINASRMKIALRSIIYFLASSVLNTSVGRHLVKLAPELYSSMRDVFYSIFGAPEDSIYVHEHYWQQRHDYFMEVAGLCEQIWCVTEHQLPEYRAKLGDAKVRSMPLVCWSKHSINTAQDKTPKDIDFLFTGSLTPHRKLMFDELQARGYKVMVGPATWSGYLRDHYIARSKICLQVLQSRDWKYPSVMRYHYLLTSGSVVVAEEASDRCQQERFVELAKTENFVDRCVEVLEAGDIVARGEKARHKYFAASEAGRKQFAQLLDVGRSHSLATEPVSAQL